MDCRVTHTERMSNGNIPLRHHYVPQMILKNFQLPGEKLHFWRRGFEPGDVKRIATDKLFVEKDLYTVLGDDGERNVALERFFAQQESAAADLIGQLLAAVRGGSIPRLDEGAWKLWHHFMYYSVKRTPGYMGAMVVKSGFQAQMHQAVAELKAKELSVGRSDGHDELEARLIKNAMVIAQGLKPSDEVMAMFGELGMVIYRVTDPAKSLVVGDVPGAMAVIVPDDSESGKSLFIPLAHDLAVGYLRRPRTVHITTLDKSQIRRMNEATTARSRVIAGVSPQLLASLSRSVRYTGPVSIGETTPEPGWNGV